MSLHPRSVLRCQVSVCLLLCSGGVSRSQTSGEALDITGWDLTVPAEANGSWPRMRVVTGAEAFYGADALAGDTGTGQAVVVTACIEGPGKLTWWWKIRGLAGVDSLSVSGSAAARLPIVTATGQWPSITGRTGWKTESLTLPAGRSVIQWTQQRSGALLKGTNAAWLDRFTFTPEGASVSIAEAVENPDVAWSVEGDALWRGIKAGEADDSPDYALFGARLPAQSPPALRLRTVLPAGWFSYRISGNATTTLPPGTDSYREQSLPDGWKIVSGRLPAAGELVLQPEWFTFGSYPEIAIDQVVTRPDNLTIAGALDAAGVIWNPGPSAASWRASPLPHESYDGADAAVFSGSDSDGSMEGTFTGPAEVRSRVRHLVGGAIRVRLGSLTLEDISLNSPTGAWREQRFLLPAGTSTLRWEGRFALDDVRVTPLPLVPGADAADTAALTWAGLNAPPGGWFAAADAAGSYDGADLLRSGPATGANVRPVSAAWSGAGTLTHRWRNGVALKLDGLSYSALTNPSAAWTPVHVEVPAGMHTVEYSGTPGEVIYEMDDFSWQPEAAPYRAALDGSGVVWAGSGDALWEVTATGAHTGGTALASPALRAGQSSRVVLGISGPATVKFRWRGAPDSPARNADAKVRMGPVQACRLVTATEWQEETLTIPSGNQTVEWVVTPLSAEGSAAGAVKLDDVRISYGTVAVEPAIVAAAGLPGQAMTYTGSGKLLVAPPAESHDGVDALQMMPGGRTPAVTEAARLEMNVTGPAELSFWWRHTITPPVELYVDGGLWMSLPAPGPFESRRPAWNRAVVSIQAPGTHTLSFRSAWTSIHQGGFWLDDMTVTSPAAEGSLTHSAGGAALDWAVPRLGEGHALPDAETPRAGSTGARMGTGAATWRCRVTGPAVLSGWWRHDIANGFAGISSGISGEYADRLRMRSVWQPLRVVLDTAGPQWIIWEAGSSSGLEAESVWLDSLQVEPWQPATAGQALGSPQLAWTATPPDLWKTTLNLRTRGVYYDSSASVPVPELSVPVTGPGFFVASASPSMAFDLDGTSRPAAAWTAIPAGPHTARWKPLLPVTAGAAFLAGMARMIPASELETAEAMDLDESTGLNLVNPPAGLMGAADTVLPLDGVDFAVSPPLTATGAAAVIRFSVTGPGDFACALNGAAADVVLTTLLDGAVVAGDTIISASTVWKWRAVSVPAGVHEIALSAGRVNFDGAVPFLLVDRVRFDPDVAAVSGAAAAIDGGPLVWRERAAQPFTEQLPPLEGATVANGTLALTGHLAPGEHSWLETPLNGPGIVSFRPGIWNSASGAPTPSIEASWGATALSLTTGFVRFRIEDSGPQNFRITWRNGTAAGTGLWRRFSLDSFSFVPDSEAGPSLGEALDAPSLNWSSAAGHWRGADFGAFGDMAVTAGDLPLGTRALRLTLPEPGTLSWRWRRDITQSGTMALMDLHTGASHNLFGFSGTSDGWASASQFFLPQQRRLEFRAEIFLARDVLAIDSVEWTPAPAVSVAEALDTFGITWATGGASAWSPLAVPLQSSDGSDVLISGPLEHGESTWVETVITPPAFVSFNWKVFSETNDRFTFSIDGTAAGSIGGTDSPNFTSYGKFLTGTAPVTLRWTYAKNGSGNAGWDTAWLDKVFIAESGGKLTAAANVSGIALTAGGNAGYSFLAYGTPLALTDGACAAFFGSSPLVNPPPSPQAWLEGTITGPGVLSLAWKGSFELLVDGVVQDQAGLQELWFTNERNSWKRVWRQFTDNGTHQIRIRCLTPGSQEAPAMVDEIRFDALQPVAAAVAPGIVWSTGGPPWFSLGDSSRPLLGSPSLAAGQSAWAEAAVTGPGLFSFGAGGRGTLILDGIPLYSIDNVNGTSSVFSLNAFVPPGPHTLRWLCTDSQRLWLYGIGIAAASQPWLPSLLDAEALWMMTPVPGGFAAGNDKPLEPGNDFAAWTAQSPPVSVLLPAAGHLEAAWSRTDFTNNFGITHQLTFTPGSNAPCAAADEWVTAASSELNGPGLVRMSLPAVGGSPPGMVLRTDRLRFVPRTPLTFPDAADTAALTWAGNDGWSSLADQPQSFDGADFLLAEIGPLRPRASLAATVSGPLALTFRWRSVTNAALGLTVDGVAFTARATSAWTCMRLDLAPGPHVLQWIVTGNTAGGKAMLDTFTAEAAGTLPGVFGPGVPAAFYPCESFSSVAAAAGSAPVEILVPGPSLLGPDTATGTLFTHAGFVAARVVLSWLAGEAPVPARPLTPLSVISLEEALDWPNPVISSEGWIGLSPGAAGEDFAVPSGTATQWIETAVTGPGILAWEGLRMDWGHAIPPAMMTVDGVPVDPGSRTFGVTWHFVEARAYTVRWTVNPSSMATLDHLHWTPFTPDNNFNAWVSSLGLTGAGALPDADPDRDGRNNVLEFAFGTNAAAADGDAGPVPVIVQRDGREYAALEFRRRNIPGLYFEMQESGPPPSSPGWRYAAEERATPSGDGLYLQHRWMRQTPLAADPAERRPLLLRLRVELIP